MLARSAGSSIKRAALAELIERAELAYWEARQLAREAKTIVKEAQKYTWDNVPVSRIARRAAKEPSCGEPS